jgi:hypothetical protein
LLFQATSQQWPPSSEDKSALIASLTTKITDTETRISRLQEDIRNRYIWTTGSQFYETPVETSSIWIRDFSIVQVFEIWPKILAETDL